MSKKKSTPRRGNKQTPKAPTSGSRTEQIIALLRGLAGASIAELTNATGWQNRWTKRIGPWQSGQSQRLGVAAGQDGAGADTDSNVWQSGSSVPRRRLATALTNW